LLSESVIDPHTIRAYTETAYRVHGEPGFTLRVGEACAELLAAHARQGVDCSAFLTAWNPFSQPTDDIANAARQAELLDALSRLGLVCMPGLGRHPSNDWPGEDSVLALGLGLNAAKALGQRFEQNAIVWIGTDAVPQLILLR
jgi:sugar phosphate isomerase/epimerase